MIEVTCGCGKNFDTWPHKIKEGKGKHCSKKCMYLYRKPRPTGLKYNVTTNTGWFKKEDIPYNKGLICPDDVREKISKSLMGKRNSPDTEFKAGQNCGKDNINWKGGITPINQKIRHSLEYKIWRTSVFERDNYTCQLCFERGGRLNADHIKPFATYYELRFDIDNGRTLCVMCHQKTPTYGGASKGRDI